VRIALVVCVCALLAGCFGGPAAKLNYYTLSSPEAPAPAGMSSTLAVYVGPVTVPEGVDRPQMVMRLDANQVAIDDLNRWAEPLKNAIPRVLADNLMRELGTPRVMISRQSAALDFDARVAVDIQHFESSPAGAFVDALWTIKDSKGSAPRTGRSTYREAGAGGAEAVAAAHSRALAKVAKDIAGAIRGR
jgi:uncharacterized lipoprotein YmbA